MICRAISEALRSEEMLHVGGAGPYADVTQPDALFVVRYKMSGESPKWLTAQQQLLVKQQDGAPKQGVPRAV